MATKQAEKTQATTDHDEIRRWIEERDGQPARVRGTGKRGGGLLRIDFGKPEKNLESISWEDFFEIFDENDLALLHQHEIHGKTSRFFKFVNRGTMTEENEEEVVAENDYASAIHDEQVEEGREVDEMDSGEEKE